MGLTEEQKNERARATAGIKTFDSDGDKPYVFISYKSDNWKTVLDEVVRYMVDNYGLRVYFDNNFDRDNDSWVKNMKNAIRTKKCQAILAFVSKEYMRSYACVMELLMSRSRATQTKHDKKLEVIPIIVDDSSDVKAARSENGTRVEIKEWGAYSELLEDTAASRWLKEPGMEGLKDKVEDLIKQKDNLTEEDLSDVAAEILGNSHERHFNDIDAFAKERFYSLLKETIERCTTDVFDPALIKVASTVPKFIPEETEKEEQKEAKVAEVKQEDARPEETTEIHVDLSEDENPEEDGNLDKDLEKDKNPENAENLEDANPEEDRNLEDDGNPEEDGNSEEDQGFEESQGQKGKKYTSTGDITFTLYGKEYTYNQSDMMLTFFAQVLLRHQEHVETLPKQNGMNCASAVNYELPENRADAMPSYFRVCHYFTFPNNQGVCIGTAYSIGDKLKKMAMLLDICGEDISVFSSEQVELPEVSAGGRGNSANPTYRIYDKTFTSNQTEMMGNVFRGVIEHHPDKLEELADKIWCVAITDYSKIAKEQRPVYFASLCVYDLNGVKYSVGGSLSMADKLKQISKLLAICGEDRSIVEIDGYEIPEASKGSVGRKKEDRGRKASTTGDITFTLYGKEYTLNQSDMMLTFFAQVLSRHQDHVETLPKQNGMNCASAVNYELPENRTDAMPSYFRVCHYFTFPNNQGVCIGTAYSIGDKLKKMAMLLDICGEDISVFSSEQVELPEVDTVGRGSSVTYRIYDKTFTSSQAEMMGNVFREVIEHHPGKLEELADKILCVAITDYSKIAKEQRPVYFSSLCVYDLNGVKYSVGGSLSMADKLKQISKLLAICGEDKDIVEIDGYELPEASKGSVGRKKEKVDYFG